MTISSSNRKAGPFIGNGSASVFAFSFRVFAASDLEVVRINVSTGAETILTINSGYTVSLNANQNSNPGGSITLVGGALASGQNLIITSNIANLQPTDLTNQGGFYPEVITDALDRATIQIQQLDEHVGRTLSYPITDPTLGTELPALAQRKGTVLAFNATTGAPEVGPTIGAVNTVSTNVNSITTVANDIANVNTTAGSIANVNNVGSSIAAVNTVSAINADVTAVAAIDSDVVIAAANVADIKNFSDVYQGAKAANPSTRNNGSALQTGDLYYNTANDRMRVYEVGTGWLDYEATAQTAATTATTQAGIATTQAGIATTQANTATNQATAATIARTGAESARDAAFGNANVYASTAAGIAATTNGQQFQVVVGVDIIRYQNTAGVAVEVARYPSSSRFETFIDSAAFGYDYSIVDQDGRMAFGVTTTGVTKAAFADFGQVSGDAISLNNSNISMQAPAPYGYTWAITDIDGRAAVGVTDAGQFKTVDLVASTLNGVSVQSIITPDPASADLGAQAFTADIMHVLSYGQSLSVGVGTFALLTTSQRFDNLRFSGGVRAQDAGTDPAVKYASLVPLIETGPGPSGSAMESPIGGATDMVKELIASENGITYTQHQYQLLGSAPGEGAMSISALSKPGTYYSRFMEDVTYGYARAQDAGKSYKVGAFFWTQGESDGGNTTYATSLSTLQGNINTDVKAITGQSEDIWCICYQIARAQIGLQFVAAQAANPKIRIAAPTYQLPSSDTVHLTAQSSKILGAYYGLAYKRLVVDGQDWKPMMPLSSLKQGKILDIKFNHHGTGMVFDTTTVPVQINYGFRLFSAANVELTISSVTITRGDMIRVVAAATIPTGAKLRYGFTDPTSHAVGTSRGNLRDNAGNTLVFNGAGINHPMHNWCVLFELAV